jgi:hypothetical protein
MKMIIILLLGTLISTSSIAGIKEKKAIRAFTAIATTATEGMKSACANTTLTSKVNIEEKYTADNIGIAKAGLSDFFSAMLEVCKDADYKEEISKIQELHFSLTDSGNKTGKNTKIYGEIKLEANSLHISLHIKYSLSNGTSSTIPNVIKELY